MTTQSDTDIVPIYLTQGKVDQMEADITAMFLLVSMKGLYTEQDVSVLTQTIIQNLEK